MATTIIPATLNVTITENLSLANNSYGNTKQKTITAQGQAIQRIMNIPTGGTTLLQLGAVDSSGTIVANNFGYFRFTNMDDTNYVTLQLYISATKSGFFRINPGDSFLLMSPEADFLCEGSEYSLADITRIQAYANTAAVDCEWLAVTS